jgi:hypothetical protein
VKATGKRRDRHALGVELTEHMIPLHASGMPVLTLVLLPLKPLWWAAVPPPGHLGARHRLDALRHAVSGVGRCLRQRRRVSQAEGFKDVAQIGPARKTVDHLHRAGRALGNALGLEVAALPAYHRAARMLRHPLSHGLGRALWPQVDDPMGRQIDDNRALTMAAAPGPRLDADGMQVGWPW